MILKGEKPHVSIGMIGHVEHGKTTLTWAIIDYLAGKGLAKHRDLGKNLYPTECGVYPDSSLFEYQTTKRHYTQIDCPTNADYYVKRLVTGTIQIDGAILVIAASEGVMPQTIQHIHLAQKLGVPKLVVFMNKTDLIDDPELIDLVEIEIRRKLDQYHFDGEKTPIISGSALKAVNGEAEEIKAITALMDAVDQYIPTPVRAVEKPFLMPIEDVFSITGRGTVATGRIERGVIKRGDPVEIVGMMKEGEKPLTSTVTGVEIFRKILDRGEADDNVGLLLRNIDQEAIKRGMVICAPKSVKAQLQFICEVYMQSQEEEGMKNSFFSGYSPQFLFRTTSVPGQITLPQEVDMVLPGDTVRFKVTLDKAIAIEIGLPFTILEGNRAIGAGKVTQILK